MQINPLPFQRQMPNVSSASSLSFFMRHKVIASLAIATFALIFMGVWLHKATTVSGPTNVTPASAKPSRPVPLATPGLLQVDTLYNGSNQQNTSTQLNVNNQPIPLPRNGSVHMTIPDVGDTTSVDFSAESHTEALGSTRSQSSTSIQIHSNNESQIEIMNSE